MMILSILLAAVTLPYWLPDEFQDAGRYEVTSQRGDVWLRRVTDDSILQLRVFEPKRLLDYKGSDAFEFLQSPRSFLPLSGRPMGSRFEFGGAQDGTSASVVVGSKCEVVLVSIQSHRQKVDGHWITAEREPAKDAQQLESWARQILSRVASSRLLVLPTARIAGAELPTSRSLFAGATMVDLDAWARARGVSLSYGKDGQSVNFTRAETEYCFPLASGSMQVNGKWQPMKDIVMEREGKWFVPLDGLPQ